jgi:hypothetical protein
MSPIEFTQPVTVAAREIDIHHSSSPTAFATAEFVTIRERLIKIGARVIEHLARSAAP